MEKKKKVVRKPSDLWGWTGEDPKCIEKMKKIKTRFCLIGREKYPSRPDDVHYHMIVWFYRKKDKHETKKMLPLGQWQNVDWGWKNYCEKDHDVTCWGKEKKQGQRTDLDVFFEDCENPDMSWKDIQHLHRKICFRYKNALTYYLDSRPKPKLPRRTVVFYGETGTGKSGEAVWFCNQNKDRLGPYYKKGATKDWWDKYAGEKMVILEEFMGKETMPLGTLLQMIDPWNDDVRIENKGSVIPFLGEWIIITTNIPVDEWYPFATEAHKKAIRRRIDYVRIFLIEDLPKLQKKWDYQLERSDLTMIGEP